MSPDLFLLSKEEMRARFEGKGSPDYPTHAGGCVCSGCHASWTELLGGYAAANSVRPLIEDAARLSERRAVLLRVAGEVAAGACSVPGCRVSTCMVLQALAAKYRREAEEK